MNLIFDTHAHYDDAAFDEDRDELLKSLPKSGVACVINVGADIESSKAAINLAQKNNYIFAAVGVHPENIKKVSQENYLKQVESLISGGKKIVAIGEIGLDYHYDSQNKNIQKEVFENQIKLALKHNLPVVVHDRDAHGDTLEILKKYHPKGVVHCFSGSVEMAREIINLGMYLGFGGTVTFKNARHAPDVVKNIPRERILLETDAPYLAPVPMRGKRCNSTYIKYVAQKIAELLDVTDEEILKISKANARKLFNI